MADTGRFLAGARVPVGPATGLRVSDFDYELPAELIAQRPARGRDAARLLVLERLGAVAHRRFRDLPLYLRSGDLLVLNDTRVQPARLVGQRAGGGAAELLLVRPLGSDRWEALGRPGRRLRAGQRVSFGGGRLVADVEGAGEGGLRTVRLSAPDGDVAGALARLGKVPLPPYIRREPEDPEAYQTVYARVPGSVAAPTAGLHFTWELLERLQARGVEVGYLTLHVGPGTFRPVRAERVDDHRLHPERYRVGPELAEAVRRTRARGGRVVAVGTTSVRALESAAAGDRTVRPGEGETSLFIRPGYRFQVTDALLTNFHLPRSTLLMLACAFGGRKAVLGAYREAIARGYRFYSFGDAMLIV